MQSSVARWTFLLGFGLMGFTSDAIAEERIMPSYNPAFSLAPLVEKMSPTVVNIVVSGGPKSMPPMPWGFPGPNGKKKRETGQGSGFIISGDGYILTNNHVIEGAEEVTVKLSNKKSHKGKVIGTDDSLDIALIKINTKQDLPYVRLGSSEKLQVGDWVVAIGNPYGFAHTVTAGIVSAKSRDINAGPYDDFIQTDASINPGNSGGPLFNLKGEVIGINTAIDRRAQGIGFSVPIDSVKKILKDLKSEGKVSRGWLGINVGELEEKMRRELGIKHGALVRNVYRNTPARKAGLKDGDIILNIDKATIKDPKSLIRRIGSYRAGDTVKMRVLRNKTKINLNVKLGKRPSEKEIGQSNFNIDDYNEELGISIAMARGFNWNKPSQRGLVITEIDNNGSYKSKFRLGDIIIRVNGEEIIRPTDLERHLKRNKKGIALRLFRRGKEISIRLKR